jgi:hypothetical protein
VFFLEISPFFDKGIGKCWKILFFVVQIRLNLLTLLLNFSKNKREKNTDRNPGFCRFLTRKLGAVGRAGEEREEFVREGREASL